MKEYKIDASGKPLGRVASEVAMIINGKADVNYVPNKVSDVIVRVSNISLVKMTGNKLETKKYYRHSGYPGALKEESFSKLLKEDPESLFKSMVKRMLPNNRLRDKKLRRIIFE